MIPLLLLLAQAPVYPAELPPIPSMELGLSTLGFVGLYPEPVADLGDPVTIDFVCARLVGAADICEAGRQRLQATLNNTLLGHITVRLLDTMQSTYTSTGDAAVDLQRVAVTGDGFAEDITARRNAVGADCIIVSTTAGNACGIAYLGSGAASCVAVVSQGCLDNSSYEHEVGHNAGLAHDQPNASSGGGYNGTSFGYCAGCGHKDVLVYPSPCGGQRIARFSNPNQFCPFHPTVPFGSATANGYFAWLNRAPIMAAFRTATGGIPAPRPATFVRFTED